MPPRSKSVISFEQPYPSATVESTGYQIQVPAVERDGTALVCRILVWNGDAKLTRDDVRITNDADVSDFLAEVKAKLRGATRTAVQRQAWRDACLMIATHLPAAITAELAKQQAQQPPSQTQATRLVALADAAELSITPDGDAFATFDVGSHRETWPLGARAFRHWLADRYYETAQSSPGAQALQDAIATLSGRARRTGTQRDIGVRLAEGPGGELYVDLADADWRVIRVDSTGWWLDPDPPVRFRRPRGVLPLPLPRGGGSLDELRPFVNPDGDDDWMLRQAWLIGVFNPRGPYAILFLTGEQGSAKSVSQRALRRVIDPNRADLRAAPREELDLLIAAKNGRIVAYDNLSSLPDWLSDAFCRLATGAGIGRRELYSDTDESLIAVARPILFNGIGDLALRGDLVDRTIAQSQPRLPEGSRRDERRLWQDFDDAHPRILGAVLDIVSKTLTKLPSVHASPLPRMADFALWVCAAETALGWKDGEFLRVYAANQERAQHVVAEASVLAGQLIAFYQELTTSGKASWEGTATMLLKILNGRLGEDELRALHRPRSGWPRDSTRLSNQLRRLAPTLRTTAQIAVTLTESRHPRLIILESLTLERVRKTAPAAPVAPEEGDLNSNPPGASAPRPGASAGGPAGVQDGPASSKLADFDVPGATGATGAEIPTRSKSRGKREAEAEIGDVCAWCGGARGPLTGSERRLKYHRACALESIQHGGRRAGGDEEEEVI